MEIDSNSTRQHRIDAIDDHQLLQCLIGSRSQTSPRNPFIRKKSHILGLLQNVKVSWVFSIADYYLATDEL